MTTKPLLVLFEVAGPFQLKPGYFKGPLGDGQVCRAWWLWFSLTWVRMDLPSYNQHLASGVTAWVDETVKFKVEDLSGPAPVYTVHPWRSK